MGEVRVPAPGYRSVHPGSDEGGSREEGEGAERPLLPPDGRGEGGTGRRLRCGGSTETLGGINQVEVCERIRKIRESKNILAKEAARKLGISASSYTLLETGQRRLRVEHIEKIAKVLKVSVAEIFGEEQEHGGAQREYKHLRPIGTPELRKKLEPFLGKQTDQVIQCFELWITASRCMGEAREARDREDDVGRRSESPP